MRFFFETKSLPKWVLDHQFGFKSLEEVPEPVWERIRIGLSRFQHSRPKVSIVMPVYNEESHLLQALSSLSQLRLPEVYPTELLIVNDGSTDRTQEIIRRLGVANILLSTNKRQKVSRTIGLHQAQGEYLLHADADTLYPPNWGLDFVSHLQRPEVVMVYGPHAFVPSQKAASRAPYLMHEIIGRIWYKIRRLRREYLNVHGFNSGLKRSVALQHGSYLHDAKGSEDGQMAWMLRKVGKLKRIETKQSLVWTSSRRLEQDGGLFSAIQKRVQKEGMRLLEYLFGREIVPEHMK